MDKRKYQICTNCVMDTSDPQITFDDNGICDFCNSYYRQILPNWHPDENGLIELKNIASKIKHDSNNNKYDCIIGMSGGTDSSFLTHVAVVELGLRPLMLTVDTGWNLGVANNNVKNIIDKLNLDLVTVTVDWEEMKDLQISFFRSAVPYQDGPQDHAIFAGLYNYAVKNGFKYILTGGNYSTECVKPPQEWTYYNDLVLLKDIHGKFGTKPLNNFPLCGMFKNRIYYRYFKGMQVVKPLNYVPYLKNEATSLLKSKYGWEEYENKHYEDILTRFIEGWWMPKKFGYDKRKCYFSSLILTGQMTRDEAIIELANPPYDEKIAMEDFEYVCNQLNITQDEMWEYFNLENRTFRDYKNSYTILKKAITVAKCVGIEKRNFR